MIFHRDGWFPFPYRPAEPWDGVTYFGSIPSGSVSKIIPVTGPGTNWPIGFSVSKTTELWWRSKTYKVEITRQAQGFPPSFIDTGVAPSTWDAASGYSSLPSFSSPLDVDFSPPWNLFSFGRTQAYSSQAQLAAPSHVSQVGDPPNWVLDSVDGPDSENRTQVLFSMWAPTYRAVRGEDDKLYPYLQFDLAISGGTVDNSSGWAYSAIASSIRTPGKTDADAALFSVILEGESIPIYTLPIPSTYGDLGDFRFISFLDGQERYDIASPTFKVSAVITIDSDWT